MPFWDRWFTKQKQPKKQLVLWPQWRAGDWHYNLSDLSNLIDEGFNFNAVIYAAIMYKVRAAGAAPLCAYEGTRDKRELQSADTPLSQLMDRANPFQSMLQLRAVSDVYFNLFGNAYVWMERYLTKETPRAMYTLRPDRVRHVYDEKKLIGYVYTPVGGSEKDEFPMLPQDTLHIPLPSPGDAFGGAGKGLSPLFPCAASVDVDNRATQYLKQFFEYGAMPPGILQFDAPMDGDQVSRARERWMEIYGGSHRWTDIAVLDQGGKYQRLGLTFSELDMANLDSRDESRIVMPFGVPLPLIDSRPDLTQSTYNNLASLQQFFWENTLIPELRWWEQQWQYYLRTPDGAFPAYDLSAVPALQPQYQTRLAQLADGFKNSAVTRAEYREAIGLPFTEADNVYMVSATMLFIPATATPRNLTAEGGAAQASDETTKAAAIPAPGMSPEQKAAVYKAVDNIARAFEDTYKQAARKQFASDEKNALAILTGAQKAAYAAKATPDYARVMTDVNTYFDETSRESWQVVFGPLFAQTANAQINALNKAYGFNVSPATVLGREWLKAYTLQFSDWIADTSKAEITAILQTALENGYTIPETQAALTTLFEQWSTGTAAAEGYFATVRLPPYRTEIIARTETIRASNAGANALYAEWGAPYKEWYSTADNRTRDTHRVGSAWGQAPLIVPVGDTFLIGGVAMQYPGDYTAPLSQTAQCRCALLPAFSRGG